MRARDDARDKRESLFLRWFAAAGVSDHDTFTPVAKLFDSWRRTSGVFSGGVAWFARRMRAAGIAPFRTNRFKGLRYQLVDINEIAASINSATAARAQARTARDAEGLASATRDQLIAKRQAGRLLDAGVAVPSLYIGDAVAEYSIALARMTDDRFERCVKIAIRQAVRVLKRSRPREPTSPIRTIVSEWFLDADGLMTRTVSGEGEWPILKGESFFKMGIKMNDIRARKAATPQGMKRARDVGRAAG
jgi:hypothetical protein